MFSLGLGGLDTPSLQGGPDEQRPQELQLEVVPPRLVPYRGVSLQEMDLDPLLARRPAVALVDELAHRDVPG